MFVVELVTCLTGVVPQMVQQRKTTPGCSAFPNYPTVLSKQMHVNSFLGMGHPQWRTFWYSFLFLAPISSIYGEFPELIVASMKANIKLYYNPLSFVFVGL